MDQGAVEIGIRLGGFQGDDPIEGLQRPVQVLAAPAQHGEVLPHPQVVPIQGQGRGEIRLGPRQLALLQMQGGAIDIGLNLPWVELDGAIIGGDGGTGIVHPLLIEGEVAPHPGGVGGLFEGAFIERQLGLPVGQTHLGGDDEPQQRHRGQDQGGGLTGGGQAQQAETEQPHQRQAGKIGAMLKHHLQGDEAALNGNSQGREEQ